jgi:TolB protein
MLRRAAIVLGVSLASVVGCSRGGPASPTATTESRPERIAPEAPLAFGDTIAFVSDAPGNYEIYVLSPGGEPVRLTESAGDEGFPVWSPDGTKISFGRREADGTVDVWIMDADGGSQHRIYDSGSVFLEGITWHPNGRAIYFSRGYFDGASVMGLKISVISADRPETQPDLLVDPFWDHHFTYSHPALTGVGRRIAFVHYQGFGMPFRRDIYVGDLAQGGKAVHSVVQLTEGEGGDLSPAWSPDGTAIAWSHETAKDSGNFDIWVMNDDGSEKRQVTSAPGEESDPVWSSDGQAVIYCSDESGVSQLYMRYAWGGEEVLQLTEDQANRRNPSVKPRP